MVYLLLILSFGMMIKENEVAMAASEVDPKEKKIIYESYLNMS